MERAGVSTVLLFEQTGHPPRREEGLPTFTLEKLVPGGIAEVSHSMAGWAKGRVRRVSSLAQTRRQTEIAYGYHA